jgi:hypothetical protein
VALRCGAADAVVLWLFDASGGAAKAADKRDANGYLPMHVALMQVATTTKHSNQAFLAFALCGCLPLFLSGILSALSRPFTRRIPRSLF